MPEMTRRTALAASLVSVFAAPSRAEDLRAWDFTFRSLDETGPLPFAQYRGRVLLVVNTASFCGYTYQYRGLEALYAQNEARGLTVVGVPSQDFNQESDSNGKVKRFCELTYGVKFPMTTISHVKGKDADPFYAWVRERRDGWEPDWNFNKVLIGRDGLIKAVFRSGDEPGGPALTAAIEQELSRPAA